MHDLQILILKKMTDKNPNNNFSCKLYPKIITVSYIRLLLSAKIIKIYIIFVLSKKKWNFRMKEKEKNYF